MKNYNQQLYTFVLLMLLRYGFGDTSIKDLKLGNFCPMYPSPRQNFGLFTSYKTHPTGPECGNTSLYVFHNRYNQYLIERPSAWSNKLAFYLSALHSPVFQKFSKMATSSTTSMNITEEEKKTFAAHMIPMRSTILRYIVKDGTDVEHCQMRVITWAKTEANFISFKVKIELSNAYRRPSSICTRPNLVVPEPDKISPTVKTPTVTTPKRTARSTVKATPRSAPAKQVAPKPATAAKQVAAKPAPAKPATAAKPVAAKPAATKSATKPAAAKPVAVKPAAAKPPTSAAKSQNSAPKGQRSQLSQKPKPKPKTPVPIRYKQYFQSNGKRRYPLASRYSSAWLFRRHPSG
ncbi:Rh157.4 [macacine betaherpesvirus 3]|uniref:RhUL130/rh175.4 n=2 Tax=Rhesus cytomegalovirus (strain 68-1) TaxID=47929 RepID=A8D0W4_RHCM6|nr:RhUL130/rh175.4 [macacine betaherpesvirus 3]QQL10987.1 Rh157.4 [macacine betaherpesvirus 3]